ncbi:protein kinase [Oxynema sp. CENA135]|uniref:serine/threonine-protein kinase n=1 Tax=Oxynema sp. CENA135 TaxID=984206 RepID=UPI00190A5705|nr:serine/threonine-protein kinase [Oxynema sp. CENA135]MBK4731303.1 protein kinase [Oxynema sp. CENA135]
MSLCLNPKCPHPENPDRHQFCQYCGTRLLLGDPIARYRPLRQIGAGGFSKTFIALDESKTGKPQCILKQIRWRGEDPETQAHLFSQEVDRLRAIGEHPQIPQFLDAFQGGDRDYVVQEFVPGQTLEQELSATGTFDESQIRQILKELLPVLHYLHQHDLIHRDLKPDNIIRRQDTQLLVLVDFGAAKRATATALAKTGTLIGSAEYTAPEQLRGHPTFASDLYSLGVSCIHLLSDLSPFDLFDPFEGKWRWRDYLLEPVSDELSEILDKLLCSHLRGRYQSAREVLKAVDPRSPIAPPVRRQRSQAVYVSQPLAPPPAPAVTPTVRPQSVEGSAPLPPVQTDPTLPPAPPDPAPRWQCVTTIAHRSVSGICAIALIPQAQAIATAGGDGTVKFWDLATGEELQEIRTQPSGPLAIAIAPDGRLLACAKADGRIDLWQLWQLSPQDLRRGLAPLLVRTLSGHTSLVGSVAFCPDKQTLASGSRDRTLKLWDLQTGRLRQTFAEHGDRVTSVAFNPQWATTTPERSHCLVSSSANGEIALWQIDKCELQHLLYGHRGEVYAVAVSGDGRHLVSSSWDRTVKIWQWGDDPLMMPALTHILTGHVLPVGAIACSPDGQTCATASHDSTIKLWNLETGTEFATLTAHSQSVVALAFSPDGTTLASGSHDGTAKLWRWG